MSLHVNIDDYNKGLIDLKSIVNNDLGLTSHTCSSLNIQNAGFLEVQFGLYDITYNPRKINVANIVLSSIINSEIPVIIHPVSNFEFDLDSSVITSSQRVQYENSTRFGVLSGSNFSSGDDYGGVTYSIHVGNNINNRVKVIHIYYDPSQANNYNYWVRDSFDLKISMPNCIILFHELVHAYHLIEDDLMNYPPHSAIIEYENILRAEKNLSIRSVSNDEFGEGIEGDSICPLADTPGIGYGIWKIFRKMKIKWKYKRIR